MQRTLARHATRKLVGLAVATGTLAIVGAVQASAADRLGPFTCTDKSGGVGSAAATVSDVRVAHHDGYDRLVVGFATANSMPQYQLTRQASSHFTRDASGQPVTLDGSAGIRIVLRNTDITPGAPSDLKPALPAIREVAQIGNFERVVSYGVGLSKAACFRVLELSGPTRLVIDVATPAGAAPQVVTSTAPAASQAGDVTAPQDLAATGHASQPAVAPASGGISLLPILALLVGIGCVALGALVAVQRLLLKR